ncbi:hypothetical protein VAPA_1c07460 [Variovorax paradoxus B4]|uniref:DUF4390 domain-containing protein n=1 Tax=Variovorax paradoxus B4 TaxID=1246301 RepID=T1X5Y9_VARPD|nr:hypothetical protein VAPA_1c07460 [Variovorax paradoxus B4]
MLAWALLLTCLLPIAVAQGRVVPSVAQMRLEQADDGVYLTAAVQFELPSLVEEVLDKGIAIYFVAEAEVFQERWYWTDRKVAQVTRHMRLAYQPLTRRWRLNVSPVPITGAAGFGVSLNQNFDSLADAMDAVKRVGRLRLGDAAEIGDEPLHQVMFRFRLDTSQLPRPFQIGVVGQADWNIVAERSAKLALEKQR